MLYCLGVISTSCLAVTWPDIPSVTSAMKVSAGTTTISDMIFTSDRIFTSGAVSTSGIVSIVSTSGRSRMAEAPWDYIVALVSRECDVGPLSFPGDLRLPVSSPEESERTSGPP